MLTQPALAAAAPAAARAVAAAAAALCLWQPLQLGQRLALAAALLLLVGLQRRGENVELPIELGKNGEGCPLRPDAHPQANTYLAAA